MIEALEAFWLGDVLRRSVWLYPLVSATHILALGMLVTSAILMDLRVLGSGTRLALPDVVAHLRVVAIFALIVALSTGAALFTVRPAIYFANPIFLTKMTLLAAALFNAGLFTLLARHTKPESWLTKFMALTSIFLWLAVLLCGRLIAFFD